MIKDVMPIGGLNQPVSFIVYYKKIRRKRKNKTKLSNQNERARILHVANEMSPRWSIDEGMQFYLRKISKKKNEREREKKNLFIYIPINFNLIFHYLVFLLC